MLLVYDGMVVRSVLNCAGIDTSNWQLGLRSLIIPNTPNVSCEILEYNNLRPPSRIRCVEKIDLVLGHPVTKILEIQDVDHLRKSK